MENTRPSRTRRNLKGSHELKVSSDITLKELKLMVSPNTFNPSLQTEDRSVLRNGSMGEESRSANSLAGPLETPRRVLNYGRVNPLFPNRT